MFYSTQIETIENYFYKIQKIYDNLVKNFGVLKISRIGCRIQGSYKTKSNDFKLLLQNFKGIFNSNLYLSDFEVNDLRFQINYNNGNYMVGPINIDDSFILDYFTHKDRKNCVGFGLDTDNYLLNNSFSKDLNIQNIKDVFKASLSVEKSLFDRLCEF